MTVSIGKATGSSMVSFVLVVDSEPQNLIFTSMIVQRLGYPVCSALGVGNALEIAGSSVPSLVISDLNLKGLGGLELLELLRQKPSTRSVPVVIMCRELLPEQEHACRKAGVSVCVEKPVQVNDLYQAIHPLLEPGTRRKDVRIRTRLSIEVNGRMLDCTEGECCTNVSVNGIYLQTRKPYPVSGEVQVRVRINDEELSGAARVVHCQEPGDGRAGSWGVGLQFIRTSPGAGEIIRRFIHDEVVHGMDAADETGTG